MEIITNQSFSAPHIESKIPDITYENRQSSLQQSSSQYETLENLPSPPISGTYEEIEEWVYNCSRASPIRNIMKQFTPLQESEILQFSTENKVFLKREDSSPVNSFKLRGAFTKISSIIDQAKLNGVYACSAGNHAQGVALTAQYYGIPSKIYMPYGAPKVKIDKVKSFGSEIVQAGETLDDCFIAAKNSMESRILIHPFDDPYIVGGTGTVALELIDQMNMNLVDYVFCPCGGGGLIAGIGLILKRCYPHIKIIGVESTEAPGMTTSLSNGQVTTLNNIGKFADGTAIKKIGDFNFTICKNVIDDMVLVTTADICKAISDAFTDTHLILEPSGALGIAGLKTYTKDNNIKGKTCIAITTGSNLDFKIVRFVSEMADIAECTFSLILPEHPGSFKELFPFINYSEITSIAYQQSESKPTSNIIVTTRFASPDQKIKWVKALETKGYDPLEISGDRFAQHHGKFLTSGLIPLHSRKRFLRLEYFSSSDKLNVIFSELPHTWDLSLVHYRHYGSDVCSLLLGINVFSKCNSEEFFIDSMKNLNIDVKDETSNPLLSRLLTSS